MELVGGETRGATAPRANVGDIGCGHLAEGVETAWLGHESRKTVTGGETGEDTHRYYFRGGCCGANFAGSTGCEIANFFTDAIGW